jgi:hypothetical protein
VHLRAGCSSHGPTPAAAARPVAAACRNALSPHRLVDTFPAPHDDIHTLYDNLESSIAEFGDVSSGAGRLTGSLAELALACSLLPGCLGACCCGVLPRRRGA